MALEVFNYQSKNNKIYAEYIKTLGVEADLVTKIEEIPFLPVSFFKTHQIKDSEPVSLVFESSSTTNTGLSKHFVVNPDFYIQNARRCFEDMFGNPDELSFVGLLPGYSERPGSSLIYMLEHLFVKRGNGLISKNQTEIYNRLKSEAANKKKVLLWGVTFALLDFATTFDLEIPDLMVIETGGMKGKGAEPLRIEVHEKLKNTFKVNNIYSEYGMTELLSQAYTKGEELFYCPHAMKVLPRQTSDPLQMAKFGETACLNIIDLANVHSCSFIATDDLGKVYEDGTFEVLGRMDNSDVRGCSLLML